MKTLNYQINQITKRNRDGSISTQANRAKILDQIATQLREAGYQHLKNAHGLKGRHINTLIDKWQNEDLAIGTIKNRMAALRWLAEKIGKSHIIEESNQKYGIEKRQYVAKKSKAKDLDQEKLVQIKDVYVKASLELQRDFGLRREEAIKFNPSYANKGDNIELKASWTKGGKPRNTPITNDQQRQTLKKVQDLVGKGSLIPDEKRYVDQLRIYEYQTADAKLSKMHGLRHAYAQQRYEKITGWKSPAAGGKTSKELTKEQRGIDQNARLTISKELGHEREQITTVYLGR